LILVDDALIRRLEGSPVFRTLTGLYPVRRAHARWSDVDEVQTQSA